MKQCKALLIKEYRTNWLTILTPLWFTAGVYVIGLAGILIGLLKEQSLNWAVSVHGVPAGMSNMILYSSIYAMSLLLGTVAVISAITLADNFINGGFKRKCEILHLCQPVSLTKILGIKYLLMVPGMILIYAVLALFNTLVLSGVFSWFTPVHLYFSLVAWMQSVVEISLSLVFLSSLFWFFAGLFRWKSFLMGILTILAIQAAISILNWTAGLQIPSLLNYLGRLASVRFEIHGGAAPQMMDSVFNLITLKWQMICNWDSVMKLIYGVLFFCGGFWLYRRRELS